MLPDSTRHHSKQAWQLHSELTNCCRKAAAPACPHVREVGVEMFIAPLDILSGVYSLIAQVIEHMMFDKLYAALTYSLHGVAGLQRSIMDLWANKGGIQVQQVARVLWTSHAMQGGLASLTCPEMLQDLFICSHSQRGPLRLSCNR